MVLYSTSRKGVLCFSKILVMERLRKKMKDLKRVKKTMPKLTTQKAVKKRTAMAMMKTRKMVRKAIKVMT